MIKTAANRGRDLHVLNAVEKANDLQKHVLTLKVKARFGEELSGRHFALWGLAFKPNTDDMREAPSREIISDLLAAGATVTAYDPVAMHEAKRIYANEPRLTFAESPVVALDCIQSADALLIATEWKVFRSPDLEVVKAKLKSPVIIDGRNLYQPKMLHTLGFEYYPIGREQSQGRA